MIIFLEQIRKEKEIMSKGAVNFSNDVEYYTPKKYS